MKTVHDDSNCVVLVLNPLDTTDQQVVSLQMAVAAAKQKGFNSALLLKSVAKVRKPDMSTFEVAKVTYVVFTESISDQPQTAPSANELITRTNLDDTLT